MLYRKMEKTGDELSLLGYGCMRFPARNGIVDESQTEEQVRYAIDNGVNYFDTAFPYHGGASEAVLGRILSKGLRDKVKLATKLPIYMVNSREDMDNFLNIQLSKLKTEHIDYYLLHNIANRDLWNSMVSLNVFDFLNQAKKDGRIINAGFSFHGGRKLFKEVVDAYDWEFCQIQYNFLDEDNQASSEGLKYAAEKGLGIIVMEPLRGGNLAGKVPDEVQKLWDKSETKRSPAEWGLRWIWNHPEVNIILSGMNKMEHIEKNIKTASEAFPNSLSKEELKLVDDVRDKYRQLMKVGCTGCNYCMPCPAGVNIPQCFEIYNNKYLFNAKSRFNYYMFVGGLLRNPSYASLCVNCGKCEKKCPQHIPIREELKSVAGEFEGPLMKPFIWIAKNIMNILTKNITRKKRKTV